MASVNPKTDSRPARGIACQWLTVLMTVGGLLGSSRALMAEPDATASSLNRFLAYEQQLSVPKLGFAPLPSPFAVGIALVPTGAAMGSIHYQDQVALLEAVQAHLDRASFINRTEILPAHSVEQCQHFSCFALLAKQFDVHAIALVSYDQITFPGQRSSAGKTKPKQTVYLTRLDQQIMIAGTANEVHTSINASLFNASSQQLLLTASGAQIGKPKPDVAPGENAEALNFTQAKSTLLQNLADGLARSEDHLKPESSVPLQEPPPLITEDSDATVAPSYAGLHPLSPTVAAISGSIPASADMTDANDSPALASTEAAGNPQAGIVDAVPAPLGRSVQHSDSTTPDQQGEAKTNPDIPAQVDIGNSKADDRVIDSGKDDTPAPLQLADSHTPASGATPLPSQTASAQTTPKPVATRAAMPSQATAGKVAPMETEQRQNTGSTDIDSPSLSNTSSRDSGLSHSRSTNSSSTNFISNVSSSTGPGSSATSSSTTNSNSESSNSVSPTNVSSNKLANRARPGPTGANETTPAVGSAKHSPPLASSATPSPSEYARAEATAPPPQDIPTETVEAANNKAQATVATSPDTVLESKQLPSKEPKRGAGSSSLMWIVGLLLFCLRRQRRANIRRI